MGDQYLVQQAVEDAENDMSTVQAAVEAIEAAIKATKPWITDQTWSGSAATTWCSGWNGFYNQILGLLNQIHAAEPVIVNQARTQAENLVASQARTASAGS